MKIQQTPLAGLLLIEPTLYQDNRGFFHETYYSAKYQAGNMHKPFVQDNISRSYKGVLRGLHYQLQQPQAKLVSVVNGAVFDVCVDIRQGSKTFAQWFGIELNDENHRQLFIPEGFAHGFVTLSDQADFFYKCTDYYNPKSEFGIHWNDPDLAITWNTTTAPILSAKDQQLPLLNQVSSDVLPQYVG